MAPVLEGMFQEDSVRSRDVSDGLKKLENEIKMAACKLALQSKFRSYEECDITEAIKNAEFCIKGDYETFYNFSEAALFKQRPGQVREKRERREKREQERMEIARQDEILENLFLSSLEGALSFKQWNANQVKYVVSLLTESSFERHDLFNRLCDDYKPLAHIAIMEQDDEDTNLEKYFMETAIFIHSARLEKNSALVHCRVGKSRSATIIIAYLMLAVKLSFEEAFKFVQKSRSFIDPNPGFCEQLEKLEKNIKAKRWAFCRKFIIRKKRQEFMELFHKDRMVVLSALE